MSEVRWHKLLRGDIADAVADGAVPLLPIGAIEQHGPHLPLDTDTNAVTTIAVRAARLLDDTRDPRALVLPEIHWGLSPYWLGFPGTLTLRPETILALFRDLAASVSHHGFHRVMIVNGHGGNAGIIAVAATAMADAGVRAAALSYWNPIATEMARWCRHEGGGIGHAGEAETSIASYLQPDLIGAMPVADACAPLQHLIAGPETQVGIVHRTLRTNPPLASMGSRRVVPPSSANASSQRHRNALPLSSAPSRHRVTGTSTVGRRPDEIHHRRPA